MKTVTVKLDLVTGSAMTRDDGELSWSECKMLMRTLCDELKFFRKRPHSPRAVRVGRIRVVLVAFEDEK